jgi:hypothetical protein
MVTHSPESLGLPVAAALQKQPMSMVASAAPRAAALPRQRTMKS